MNDIKHKLNWTQTQKCVCQCPKVGTKSPHEGHFSCPVFIDLHYGFGFRLRRWNISRFEKYYDPLLVILHKQKRNSVCIWPFVFDILLEDLDKAYSRKTFLENSNVRKIARMLAIWRFLDRLDCTGAIYNFQKFRVVQKFYTPSKTLKNFRDRFAKLGVG